MGVETLSDVEESTEPPICAIREYNLNPHGTAALSVEHANEKPTPPPTTRSLSPSIDLHAFPKFLQGPEDQIREAHLLEPARIAELLKTDLKYGTAHCTTLDHRINQRPFLFSDGLSNADASERLRKDGPNSVKEVKSISVWGILLRQVSNSLTIVCVCPDLIITERPKG